MLTQQQLRQILNYDPESGIFTWKIKIGKMEINQRAGSYSNDYRYICVNYENYYEHRLAYIYMTGNTIPNGYDVHHINHVPDDNRWVNLQLLSHRDNCRDRSTGKSNKTGVRGLYKSGSGFVYRKNGKYIKSFKTIEEAKLYLNL